jgi:trehalose utilization protein
VFYFRPGHETYPTYYNENVQKVIVNAVKWAAPVDHARPVYGNAQPLEEIKGSN